MLERRHTQDRRALPRGGRRSTDPPAEWLSITAYAQQYGVTRGTVYKWLTSNLLCTYRLGPVRRIRNLPPDQHASERTEKGPRCP